MRLHHVALQVNDLERARAFYGDVLGLREVRRQAHSVWLDLEGGILMLERAAGPVPERSFQSDEPGLHLLALCIDKGERDAWRQKLEQAGHPVVHETRFTLYVRDPEGNRVGLSHYPDEQ